MVQININMIMVQPMEGMLMAAISRVLATTTAIIMAREAMAFLRWMLPVA